MCKRVNRLADRTPGEGSCRVRDKCRFVNCAKKAVYNIVCFLCGKAYTGQTGRCLNDRLWEHKNACKLLQAPGNLAVDCAGCGCQAHLERTINLARPWERQKCEVMKAFCQDVKTAWNVQQWAFDFPHQKEIELLERRLHHGLQARGLQLFILYPLFHFFPLLSSSFFFRFFYSLSCGRKEKLLLVCTYFCLPHSLSRLSDVICNTSQRSLIKGDTAFTSLSWI